MPRFLNPPTVPFPTSRYSQAVALGPSTKRVIVSSQIGADAEGNLADGIEAQMELAFDNFLKVVTAADLTLEDVVRVNAYVTVTGSMGLFRSVRESRLGKAKPASTYLEVSGLSMPLHLVEIDGEAVREAPFAPGSGSLPSVRRR